MNADEKDIELGEVSKSEDDTITHNINEELKEENKTPDTYSENIFSTLKEKVYDELIEPAYYDDIRDGLKWRYMWRKIANFTEGLSQVIHAGGAIFSFASGFYNIPWMAFIAGCCSVVVLVMVRFTTYSNGESRERTNELNKLLDSLKMRNMPYIIDQLNSSDKIDR